MADSKDKLSIKINNRRLFRDAKLKRNILEKSFSQLLKSQMDNSVSNQNAVEAAG